MKKAVIIITALIFIFAFALGIYIYNYTVKELATAAKCPPTVTGVRTVPFELTVKAKVSKIPKGSKKLDLWMPYPSSTKGQTITDVSVKAPYPVEINHEKKYGNAILHLKVDNPSKDFTLTLKASAIREEVLAARFVDQNVKEFTNNGNFDLYMKADRVGQITPLIKGIAKKVIGDKTTTIDKARAIFDYINGTYEYDSKKQNLPKERGYLPHVCSVLKGRCTELSSLFSALARSQGIPARSVVGYTFKNAKEGKIDGYCCWAEFFVPGYGWVPVDLASAKKFPKEADYYFGNLDEDRIELVTGRDIELSPAQKGKNINVFIYPYAEIDGKVFEINQSITWKSEL